ncbi:hypothetical protein EDC04DRAFT_478554 [Pisolithus marmoratus]|nr:hypothetical protein EDC04DRAFT_478554 [Pisolithus marmoratus]
MDPEIIINAFVNFIHPAFVNLVAITAFTASLFTLFVVLLAFSTQESRRRMVFRLNVLAICLVLTLGVLVGIGNGKVIFGQLYWLPRSVAIAEVVFGCFPPVLCDSILLTRFFAIYPLSTTRPAILLKIFVFPCCVKCARVVVLTLFLNDYVWPVTVEDDNPFFRNPYLIAEWSLQITDNMYSVGFFLYNLHIRMGSIKRVGGIPARIRQIFYISAANFVFPLMFNIVLLIFNTTIGTTNQLLSIGELLVLINCYITIMGVLCATLWSSRSECVRTHNEPLPDNVKLNLRRVHDKGRK